MFAPADPEVVAQHLTDGAIHLWWWGLSRPAKDFSSYLTPAESARLRRIGILAERQRMGAARGGLRHILAGYVSRPSACSPWVLGRHGKPALNARFNPAGIHFNLAHSRRHAVVAVSRGVAVGVDVEQKRASGHFGAIAEKYFSQIERNWLRMGSSHEAHDRFLRLWTMKEAAIKAAGWPAATGLREFQFFPRERRLSSVPSGIAPPSQWRIDCMAVATDTHIAVAGVGGSGELHAFTLE